MNEEVLEIIREDIEKEYDKSLELFLGKSDEEIEMIKKRIKINVYKKYRKDITETNNIYLLLGQFHTQNGIEYKSPFEPQYSKYKDLEDNKIITVSNENRNLFYLDNTVIFPRGAFTDQEFYPIQEFFVNEIIEHGNEEAVRRLKIINKHTY